MEAQVCQHMLQVDILSFSYQFFCIVFVDLCVLAGFATDILMYTVVPLNIRLFVDESEIFNLFRGFQLLLSFSFILMLFTYGDKEWISSTSSQMVPLFTTAFIDFQQSELESDNSLSVGVIYGNIWLYNTKYASLIYPRVYICTP